MTSNQLQYWRNQEEARANLAREQENVRHNIASEGISSKTLSEDIRHNRESEAIQRVQNNLREKGLEIDRAANLTKIQELYGKYGTMALNQMPNSMQSELATALGIDSESFNDADFDSTLSSVWEEIKSVWSTFWGAIKSLF